VNRKSGTLNSFNVTCKPFATGTMR
jgi:hypothetical protein